MNETPYANSLFEQPWWLDIVAPGQWHEASVKDENGRILARMPYVLHGKHIVMPPLTQTLGVWMAPESTTDYGVQKKVLTELLMQLKGVKSVEQALSPVNQYVLPFRWQGFRMEPHFTYRLENLCDCDALYQRFNKTAKKNIKYAGNKVQVNDKTDAERLWNLLDKTFAAQNRKNPMSRELGFRLIGACEANGSGKYLDAIDTQGNVHSCAYFVFDRKTCYYLLGASDPEFRSSGAQSLLLWKGIQFASQHSETFDFEGSMIEGIENFFRQFGGVCTPYYTVTRKTFAGEVMEAAKPRVKRLLGYKM